MAFPWSWFVKAGIAYPSLSEIEGSRIVLKDGIYHLATGNLVSWWPFLCFALITYGLLPRLILLLVALYKKGSSLAALRFDQAVFDRLLVSMQTPSLSTGAIPDPMDKPATLPPEHLEASGSPSGAGLTVLIPEEVFARCSEPDLKQALAKTGGIIRQTIKFAEDYESDRLLLEKLAVPETEHLAILILAEAWMPPIIDFIVFIKDLRRALPPSTPIRIGLIGRPGSKSVFNPVAPADYKIWQQKMDSLGDAYLSVEQLGLP
jgi:hypothetical protein